MIDLGAVQSVLHGIKASLDQVEQLVLSSSNPSPGLGSDDGPRGFQPHEVGMISSVLRASGAYAHVGNPDAFLGNFLGVIQGAPQPTGPSDIRAILDAALVVYSDGNGDGVADLPPFPSSVADSAWEILSQAFASQPSV